MAACRGVRWRIRRLAVSASAAIGRIARWRRTRGARPKPRGGDRRSRRRKAHPGVIRSLMAEKPGVTPGSCRTSGNGAWAAGSQSRICRLFGRHGMTFKKSRALRRTAADRRSALSPGPVRCAVRAGCGTAGLHRRDGRFDQDGAQRHAIETTSAEPPFRPPDSFDLEETKGAFSKLEAFLTTTPCEPSMTSAGHRNTHQHIDRYRLPALFHCCRLWPQTIGKRSSRHRRPGPSLITNPVDPAQQVISGNLIFKVKRIGRSILLTNRLRIITIPRP